jgi:hypothetical protein
MKLLKAVQRLKIWFRNLIAPQVAAPVADPTPISTPVPIEVIVAPEIETSGHEISGNAGIAAASVLLSGGPVSKIVVADAEGFYLFTDLPDGTYVVKPSAPTPGHTFLPEIQIVTIAGEDVGGISFIDPSSVVDSRAISTTTPNSSRNVQGTLIYDVPKVDSRVAGAPVDCRVSKPVDCRVSPNIPQNSRS